MFRLGLINLASFFSITWQIYNYFNKHATPIHFLILQRPHHVDRTPEFN